MFGANPVEDRLHRKTAPIPSASFTSTMKTDASCSHRCPSFLVTSVYFRDGLGSTALSGDLTSLSGDLDAEIPAELSCLSGVDLSADLTSLSADVDTNDAELPEIREHKNNKIPASVGEELEFVAAEDDVGLIQMMASLGLPTTFGTSSEVRSLKQVRKVKQVSSQNLSLRSNTTTANSEIVEEVGSLGAKLLNLSKETASRPQGFTQIATSHSDCHADEAKQSTEALESLVIEKDSENSSKFGWEAVWDAHYKQYYYCNLQTWETTWDIPKGFEDHLNTSYWETSNGHREAEVDQGTEGLVIEILEQTEGDESKCDSELTDHSPDFAYQEVSGGITCDFSAGANQLAEAGVLASSSEENVDVSLLSVEVRSQTGERNVLMLATSMERTLSSGSGDVPSQLEGENLERQENSGVQRVHSEQDLLNQDDHGGLPQSCGTHIRFEDSDESGHIEELDVAQTQIPSHCTKESDIEMETKMGPELWSQTVPGVDAAEKNDDIWADEDDMVTLLSARKRKRKLKRSLARMPTNAWCGVASSLEPGLVEEMSKRTAKYWYQRYRLFTRYDEGIKMDEEGWFSVTPESIAKHHASRMCSGLIIDAFTGVGGNAIQFALRGHHVIAIDIDPVKIEYAEHNAGIYGVADLIEFIVGDFLKLAPSLKADAVFLSPPWGGPSYLTVDNYDLHSMLQPVDGFKLFQTAQAAAPNVAIFLPRNVDLNELAQLSWLATPPLACEVEKNYVNGKLKAITAYYGEIASMDTT